jgi:hypothetical protein
MSSTKLHTQIWPAWPAPIYEWSELGIFLYWDTQKMKIYRVAPRLSWFPFVWWCIWVSSTKLYTQIWPTWPAPIYEWSELGIFLYWDTQNIKLTRLLLDCLGFLLFYDVYECPLQNFILRYGSPDRHPYTSGQNSGFFYISHR